MFLNIKEYCLKNTCFQIFKIGGTKAELYRNRKGFFSVNVQTTCDASLKITNIVARWPGSAHDANIFRNSKIYRCLERGDFGQSFIVADSGYQNKKYIMTPLVNVTTPEENLYNESLIRTRCCVERSYGVWKRRFPILSLGMRLKLEKVQCIIVATAVLHNICCINGENEAPSLSTVFEEAIDFVLSTPSNRGRGSSNYNNVYRRILVNDYFKKLVMTRANN